MTRPRIGIVLPGVPDLSGGGGVERYFADFAEAYATALHRALDVTLLTDESSLRNLQAIGRDPSTAITLLDDVATDGRLGSVLGLWRAARSGRFDLIHLVQALPRHLPWLWLLSRLPPGERPAITLNINDTRLAALLSQGAGPQLPALERIVYRTYFNTVQLDGVMAWYEAFAEAFSRSYPDNEALVHAAQFCAVDTDAFVPDAHKERWAVFSGRLIDYKQPMMFVEAIAIARRTAPELLRGWTFFMFGDGPLGDAVRARVGAAELDDIVEFGEPGALAATLGRSSAFVSPQDVENFTSLAMLEAMACGNAIIARNVGQTRAFVRDHQNGLLCEGGDAETLATTILAFLNQPEEHESWQLESRRIALEEHCWPNVVNEFETFWLETLARTGRIACVDAAS